jgi:hypothetical protein
MRFMKDSHGIDVAEPASVHGPGRAPAGIPLTIRLGEREFAALVRIARHRETTAAELVEQLVLPPPAESHPARKHTTYEEATAGFRADHGVGASTEL